MLYTRKGDDGTTGTFGSKKRITKASCTTWALGSSDELNSLLGYCRAKSRNIDILIYKKRITLHDTVLGIQQDLFILQAELAGADKSLSEEKVQKLETYTDEIESQLPKIKSFLIPGETELGALFDYARTIARRTERHIIDAQAKKEVSLGKHSLQYINRLSSTLYAFARYINYREGATEQKPNYL